MFQRTDFSLATKVTYAEKIKKSAKDKFLKNKKWRLEKQHLNAKIVSIQKGTNALIENNELSIFIKVCKIYEKTKFRNRAE